MPYNGSGTFSRLYSWVVDAANNVDISSSRTDAEMNGFAAGLTNCITRDGQSPPTANIPWGGMRLTNLGAATVGSDALNRDTADARYLQSILGLTFNNGGAGVASGTVYDGTGAITISYNSIGAAPLASPSFTGPVTLSQNNVSLNFTDANGGTPHLICQSDNHLVLYGTDGAGAPRAIFSVIMQNSSSAFSFAISAAGVTPATSDNSTTLATTAYVKSNLASYAPVASPTFTGTPAAPTAAAGTATTQIATTAFVDGLRDVPSNAQTVGYTLALTDRGKGVDFNGASLTCTIPANGSVAFPVGSVIVITNLNASNLSIAVTTDTLTLAGTTTTGTRTLSQNGTATLRKVGTTAWLISGAGLS